MKKPTYTGSQELLKALPRGAVMDIARKRNVSYPFIYNIAAGNARTSDLSILQELYKLAEINEQIKSVL
jgi:hypothetical protein